LAIVPNTGHLVFEETPSSTDIVADFLDRPTAIANGGSDQMTELSAGVTRAKDSYESAVWNILGQTYTLKEFSEGSMSWHALLPPGSFVPPHIHPTQDEFIYMIEGKLDLELEGKQDSAGPGDLIRLPMNKAHGLFNHSSAPVRCLFWVSPARKLRALFEKLHNLTDPAEVVRISAQHEVNFLPPKS
jgi:uncharacterized cupin superfamily protein